MKQAPKGRRGFDQLQLATKTHEKSDICLKHLQLKLPIVCELRYWCMKLEMSRPCSALKPQLCFAIVLLKGCEK